MAGTKNHSNKGDKSNRKQGEEKLSKKKKSHSETNFMIAGIGASAGGLEALEEFFKNMPANSGLGFVVVQHLSPDYKSLMGELLSRYTDMSIYRVEDGMIVEPNSIYLIPPKKNMSLFHKRLYLTDQDHKHGLNLPIDIFLRSLAEDMGKNSIGIILSGTGSDGSLGIRAIKEAGGMVMVQDDRSAKFDGMPRSSIATGIVDYVLPATKMPQELVNFIKHPYIKDSVKFEHVISKDEDLLTKVIKLIKDRVGVDFSTYKPNTIIRRLEKRISINQITKFDDYVNFMVQSSDEVHILYKELLIGVTQFFRDPDAYEKLKQEVIPKLFRKSAVNYPVRIWSAGCSTGEEAYSLVILIREYMEENKLNNDIKVFATDIDRDAIETASFGMYPESIASDVSPDRLKKYFTRKDKGYQINENLRRMVIFATHNIISDPPFTKIDMITCRNLLIYLDNNVQKKIISMFYYSLNKNGTLFLGSSETVGEISKGFDTINSRWKIFEAKPGYRPPVVTNFALANINKGKKDIIDTELKSNLYRKQEVNIFEKLLQDYIPPCVIVDQYYDIVHVFKDVNKYIKIPPGKLNFNLLKMINKDLSVVISSMLHKVAKENRSVVFNDIEIKNKNEEYLLKLEAKPVYDEKTQSPLYLVSFEDKAKAKDSVKASRAFDMKGQYTKRFEELEKELQYTRENLQATIEELETSNEELQSTNEELIASNEELQSTNEELQSVNEELYTVNSEYQNKIEELTQLNNDMENLMKNTNVGMLFLDIDLKIRKFTPVIEDVFNLMEMDIGRPFTHINHNLKFDSMKEKVENALESLEVFETEVVDRNNHYFFMKILPYRTMENAIEGVVITMLDITGSKESNEKIKSSEHLLNLILENSPLGKVMVNSKGRITYVNKKATQILGASRSKLKKRNFNDKQFKIKDLDGKSIPASKLPFSLIMKEKKEIKDFRHLVDIPEKGKKVLSISGSPILTNKNQINGIVFSIDDISDAYEMERELEREKALLRRTLDHSFDASLIVDGGGTIVYANASCLDLFKMDLKEVKSRQFNDAEWKILDAEGKEPVEGSLPFKQILTSGNPIDAVELSILDGKGKRIKILVKGLPVFDSDSKIEGVIFSLMRLAK